jgi:DNA-binding response OmpR family regulator
METATLLFGAELGQRLGETSIQVGTASVNLRSGATQNPNGRHRLRPKELELLTFLYQNTGAIFSRDELLRRVWNHQGVLLTRTVDQTVATLRRKLNDNNDRPGHLITVHGIGYRLEIG